PLRHRAASDVHKRNNSSHRCPALAWFLARPRVLGALYSRSRVAHRARGARFARRIEGLRGLRCPRALPPYPVRLVERVRTAIWHGLYSFLTYAAMPQGHVRLGPRTRSRRRRIGMGSAIIFCASCSSLSCHRVYLRRPFIAELAASRRSLF